MSKEEMTMIRIPMWLKNEIEALAKTDNRSITKMGEIVIKAGIDTLTGQHGVPTSRRTVPHILSEGDMEANLTEAARENAKNGKITVAKDPCPHGYAKGMCKKESCNKKFQK